MLIEHGDGTEKGWACHNCGRTFSEVEDMSEDNPDYCFECAEGMEFIDLSDAAQLREHGTW